jgi:hypothetical protein
VQQHAPGGSGSARRTESGDRLVSHEQHLAVAADSILAGREERVERGLIVAEHGRFVGPERVEQTGGNRLRERAGHWATSAKSASRIRAAAPVIPSTTCEISKSVAAAI